MGMNHRSNFQPCLRAARLGALLLFVLAAFFIQAQEVRNVNGRKHFVHKVEQGQTLYAIGRTYAVGVEDIVKANPTAAAGLSIGQELLIPADAVNRKEARNAPKLAADGELIHTVAKRETIFGIARDYGIDINLLLERNPDLNSGLREGMEVVIPVKPQANTADISTQPAVPQRMLDHIVQPGETLYSLGKLYVVDPRAIQAANNGLPEGLKAGMTVKIPLRHGVEQIEERPAPPEMRSTYKVGMLLPFSVDRNDSIIAANTNDPSFHEPSRIAAQFYAGALLALDSLERIGLRADVSVLDLGDEAKTWNPVLRKPELSQMDLFIGPFHRTAIEQLLKVNRQAHIVCPVPQASKLLLGNPTVSKVTPTRSDLIRHTAAYVAHRHAKDNIIMLAPDIFADKDIQDQMLRALQDALNGRPDRTRDSVLVIRKDRKEIASITAALDPSRMNVIVAPSQDMEFVTAIVNALEAQTEKHRITLVGLESWLQFETVSAEDLDRLQLVFAASTFIDRNDPATQRFIQQFRERNDTSPDEYAFLGFDVTFHYLKALMTQGVNFAGHISEVHTDPLHMEFRMVQAGPENGFRNEGAIMLRLQDLQLVRAQ